MAGHRSRRCFSGQHLDWFWNYWLSTTESVNGGIKDLKTAAGRKFAD